MQKELQIIKNYAYEILIFVLLLFMYFKQAVVWVNEWLNFDSFYSYGLFFPIFTFFYIKKNFKKILDAPKKISYSGLLVLLFGVLVYTAGVKVEYDFLTNLSFIIVMSGIIIFLWGYRIFYISILPLIVLTLCLPILPVIRVTAELQLFLSKCTAVFLAFLGIKTSYAGSIIYMNGQMISVEPGCTGLKSLLNLMAISFMYSYFLRASNFKKSVFVLSSIPITFINNILRISLSGFYAMYNSYSGFEAFHNALGIIFYVIGIALLFLISKLIERPDYE
jgi:exosortase